MSDINKKKSGLDFDNMSENTKNAIKAHYDDKKVVPEIIGTAEQKKKYDEL